MREVIGAHMGGKLGHDDGDDGDDDGAWCAFVPHVGG